MTIWQCTFQRFLWTLWDSKSLFLTSPPSSKQSSWSCKPILVEDHQDSSWGGKGSMAGWTAGCVMGIQDDYENPYRGNPFQASLWKWGSYTCRGAHGKPQGSMYQDKDNEEQLCLNLDLIDGVIIDADERTTRYKNFMARQYDAMVKPRWFNIGDLVLKKISLATKNPAHGKLGSN